MKTTQDYMPKLILSEKEKIVKQYNCLGINTDDLSDTVDITITTKRLIKSRSRDAKHKSFRNIEHFMIDDIKKVTMEKAVSNSPNLIRLGILIYILAIAVAVPIIIFYPAFWMLTVPFLILAAIMGIFAIKKGRKVKTTSCWLSIELKNTYAYAAAFGVKGKSHRMNLHLGYGIEELMEELMPIIFDIQDMGEGAVEKWNQGNTLIIVEKEEHIDMDD